MYFKPKDDDAFDIAVILSIGSEEDIVGIKNFIENLGYHYSVKTNDDRTMIRIKMKYNEYSKFENGLIEAQPIKGLACYWFEVM